MSRLLRALVLLILGLLILGCETPDAPIAHVAPGDYVDAWHAAGVKLVRVDVMRPDMPVRLEYPDGCRVYASWSSRNGCWGYTEPIDADGDWIPDGAERDRVWGPRYDRLP